MHPQEPRLTRRATSHTGTKKEGTPGRGLQNHAWEKASSPPNFETKYRRIRDPQKEIILYSAAYLDAHGRIFSGINLPPQPACPVALRGRGAAAARPARAEGRGFCPGSRASLPRLQPRGRRELNGCSLPLQGASKTSPGRCSGWGRRLQQQVCPWHHFYWRNMTS